MWVENTEETSRRWKTYGSAASGGGGEPPLSCAQSVFDGEYRIEDRLFSQVVPLKVEGSRAFLRFS